MGISPSNAIIYLQLTKEIIESLPEAEGFYYLLDEKYSLITIAGTANLRKPLKVKLEAESPDR